jgi:hypothetical protein
MRHLVRLSLAMYFLLLALDTGLSAADADPKLKLPDKDVQALNDTAWLLGKPLRTEDVKNLQENLKSECFPVKALAAAILYRHDQREYDKVVLDLFSVHDYVQRSKGDYNDIGHQEITEMARAVERQNPGIKDRRIFLLVLYAYYRDANKWFILEGKRVSAARFFRSAFLSSVFEGSKINTLELVNTMDRVTAQADLKNGKSP